MIDQSQPTADSDPDWPGNWPEVTEAIREIAVHGYIGTEADYDRAHAELVKRGFTANAAQHLIMSSCW
jgi:hypothetical protein